MGLVLAIAAFGGGAWLLVEAVETLVGTLRGWASAAGLSGVVLAALVLGLDLESTAAGVAATLDDLPGTALGTSIGAAILLLTLGLGLAGLVAPFAVRPPTGMLAAAVIAAVLPSALAADGALTREEGAVLVAVFPPLVWLVARGRDEPAAREGAGASRPPRLLARLLLALAGLVVGAELLVWGTGRIVADLDLSETVFGLLIVAAAVCFEELVLEMLPAYRGFPELSVGNALGTLVFLLTASLGVIVLVRPLTVPDAVVELHVPVLLGATAVVTGLLARGRIGRAEGALLTVAYVAYVVAAILVG